MAVQGLVVLLAAVLAGSFAVVAEGRSWRATNTTRPYCASDLPAPYFCTGSILKATLLANQIIPDVIPKAKYSVGVKIAYGDRPDVIATFVNRTIAATAPRVAFSNPNNTYTLLMVDPDARSRWNNSVSQIFHWGVANIQNGNISTGSRIISYRGPSPPLGGGLHRYVFLVYKQARGLLNIAPFNESDPNARRSFDAYTFARANGLGREIAGASFILTQF